MRYMLILATSLVLACGGEDSDNPMTSEPTPPLSPAAAVIGTWTPAGDNIDLVVGKLSMNLTDAGLDPVPLLASATTTLELIFQSGAMFELREDGTLIHSISGLETTGTWSLAGTSITVSVGEAGGAVAFSFQGEISLEGNLLVLTGPSESVFDITVPPGLSVSAAVLFTDVPDLEVKFSKI